MTSTLPEPRSTIDGMNRLARCTVDVTLTAMTSSSLRRSVSWNGPPLPTPAFRASASTGRPVASTWDTSCSQPSYVDRSACTGVTCDPNERSTSAATSMPGSSAATTTSKSCSANCLASSSPMPLDAPVTTARGRPLPVPVPVPGESDVVMGRRSLWIAERRAQEWDAQAPAPCPERAPGKPLADAGESVPRINT